MRIKRNPRYWLPAVLRGCLVLVVIALPLSCDMFLGGDNGSSGAGSGVDTGDSVPPGNVRLQGRLGGLVTSAGIEGSSLSSAVVNVAAISVVAGNANIEATQEVEVSQEDGSFSVDLEPEESSDYVLLVNGPENGVGVEQSLGFIELPAGAGEASTGWPIGASTEGTAVELGVMNGTSGSFTPGTNPEDLYDLLGVDQAELLFAAQRDNAVKMLSNIWLNRDADFQGYDAQLITTKLNGARDAWTTPETVTLADDGQGYFGYYYGTDFFSDVWTWSDFADGPNEFVFTPPDTVVPQGDRSRSFGPDNPVGSALYWPNGGGASGEDIAGLNFLGPPVEGLWRLEINGELEATYDLSFGSLYGENGVFLYFLPLVRVNTNETTDRIESFELRFQVWDYELEQYVDLPLEDVPVEWNGSWGAAADDEPLHEGAGGEIGSDGTAVPDAEIYWPTAASGRKLWQFGVSYDIGELNIAFVFQPDYNEL